MHLFYFFFSFGLHEIQVMGRNFFFSLARASPSPSCHRRWRRRRLMYLWSYAPIIINKEFSSYFSLFCVVCDERAQGKVYNQPYKIFYHASNLIQFDDTLTIGLRYVTFFFVVVWRKDKFFFFIFVASYSCCKSKSTTIWQSRSTIQVKGYVHDHFHCGRGR